MPVSPSFPSLLLITEFDPFSSLVAGVRCFGTFSLARQTRKEEARKREPTGDRYRVAGTGNKTMPEFAVSESRGRNSVTSFSPKSGRLCVRREFNDDEEEGEKRRGRLESRVARSPAAVQ